MQKAVCFFAQDVFLGLDYCCLEATLHRVSSPSASGATNIEVVWPSIYMFVYWLADLCHIKSMPISSCLSASNYKWRGLVGKVLRECGYPWHGWSCFQ